MATGIKVSGKFNKVTDNNVKADGVGIDIQGENNVVQRNIINVQDSRIKEIIEQLNLPESLPPEYLLEAISILSNCHDVSNAPQALETSNLRKWLQENGFNMGFWCSTAISLAGIALGL